MANRIELLREYQTGVRTMDPERAMSVATPDFQFVDGALDYLVTRENFSDYLLGWESRMQSIGGTGRYEVSDELEVDSEEYLLRWGWWKFIGTEIEGSALVKVIDTGVLYEKIAYYQMPPKLNCD
jgi:hypothetical protein